MCPHCKAIISHVKCWKHFQANTITFEAVLLTFFFHSLPLCLHTCKEEELTAMKICSLFLLRVRKNTFCAFCWGQLPTLYQNNIVFKILNTPLNLGSKCRFQTLALMLAPFSFDFMKHLDHHTAAGSRVAALRTIFQTWQQYIAQSPY